MGKKVRGYNNDFPAFCSGLLLVTFIYYLITQPNKSPGLYKSEGYFTRQRALRPKRQVT